MRKIFDIILVVLTSFLCCIYKQLVTALIVSAKADPNLWSAPLDPSDDDAKEHSRLVMFECRIHDGYESSEAKLDKVGEWYLDGPVNGLCVRRDLDGNISQLIS